MLPTRIPQSCGACKNHFASPKCWPCFGKCSPERPPENSKSCPIFRREVSISDPQADGKPPADSFPGSAGIPAGGFPVVPSGHVGRGTTPLPLINKPSFPFDGPTLDVRN